MIIIYFGKNFEFNDVIVDAERRRRLQTLLASVQIHILGSKSDCVDS